MSEQELRDGLVALVADEPPLAFDPDAVMARADAANRRRRTLVGASGATLVIAAAAVALPIALRGGGEPTGATAGGSGTVITTTPSRFAWPPAHNRIPNYSFDEVKAAAVRLQKEAGKVFQQAVPEASGVKADTFAGEAFDDYHAGQRYLSGAVHYTTKQGKAAVSIEVTAGATAPPPEDNCDGDPKCQIKRQSDGTVLVVSNLRQGDYLGQTVRQYRLDGVVVSVTGFNADAFTQHPTPNLKAIPVTTAQLTRIATDGALTL